MIRLGKTFGNLMIDLQPTNSKLRLRARRIVEQACGITAGEADQVLASCDGDVKAAIVVTLSGVAPESARRRLHLAGGVVRLALTSGQ